jgi:hypothetical protein
MALLGRPPLDDVSASPASRSLRFALLRTWGNAAAKAIVLVVVGSSLGAGGDEPRFQDGTDGPAFFQVVDTAGSDSDDAASGGGETGTGAIRELLLKNLGARRSGPAGTREAVPQAGVVTDRPSQESSGKGGGKSDEDEPNVAFETAKGSSSTAVKKQAALEVPITELAAADRARAQSILDETSYFRRLPTLTVPVVPEVYLHFLGHPDTAASVWRAMNISKLKLHAVSPTAYEGDTGDGTTGRMELVHRKLGGDGVEQLVVLCEGSYKSPLLPKPIQARSMLVMRTKFTRETDGQVYATHRGDVFVTFPSQTVEAVSKLMTPVTAMLSDRTFCEVTVFLKLMSAAMCRRPDWVEHVVEKMEGVPEERKRELLVLTAQTFVSRNREALSKGITRVKAVDAEGDATREDSGNAGKDKPGVVKGPGVVNGNVVTDEAARATIRPAAAEQPAQERVGSKASGMPTRR